MTQDPTPVPGQQLTEDAARLLVKGDVLRCTKGSDEAPAIATGEVVSFVRLSGSGGVSNCIVTSADESFGYRPGRFTFIGRPDAKGWIPTPDGGWKEPPVSGCLIDVQHQNGSITEAKLSVPGALWRHDDPEDGLNIIAFRLSRPASIAPEQVGEKPNRNRPTNWPGGMECETCGCIFIGDESHSECAVCVATPPAPASGAAGGDLTGVAAEWKARWNHQKKQREAAQAARNRALKSVEDLKVKNQALTADNARLRGLVAEDEKAMRAVLYAPPWNTPLYLLADILKSRQALAPSTGGA